MPPNSPNLSKKSYANRLRARMIARGQIKMENYPSSVNTVETYPSRVNTVATNPSSVNTVETYPSRVHTVATNPSSVVASTVATNPSSVVASTVANSAVTRRQKKHVTMNPDATYRQFGFNLNHNETKRYNPSVLRSEHTIRTHDTNGVAGVAPVIPADNKRRHFMQTFNSERANRGIIPNNIGRSMREVQMGINVPRHNTVSIGNQIAHIERYTGKLSKKRNTLGGKRRKLTKKKRN